MARRSGSTARCECLHAELSATFHNVDVSGCAARRAPHGSFGSHIQFLSQSRAFKTLWPAPEPFQIIPFPERLQGVPFPMSRKKITVVGAGNVGATCAQRLAERDYADVVLVDIVDGIPQGKALDINQAGPVVGYEASVTGTIGYEETTGSDIVIITSGFPRQPGMSRHDLLAKNTEIVGGVSKEIADSSPDAIVIVVTNP